jgi:hypothetical protein
VKRRTDLRRGASSSSLRGLTDRGSAAAARAPPYHRPEGGREATARPAARRLTARHAAARGCQLQPLVRPRHAAPHPRPALRGRASGHEAGHTSRRPPRTGARLDTRGDRVRVHGVPCPERRTRSSERAPQPMEQVRTWPKALTRPCPRSAPQPPRPERTWPKAQARNRAAPHALVTKTQSRDESEDPATRGEREGSNG